MHKYFDADTSNLVSLGVCCTNSVRLYNRWRSRISGLLPLPNNIIVYILLGRSDGLRSKTFSKPNLSQLSVDAEQNTGRQNENLKFTF